METLAGGEMDNEQPPSPLFQMEESSSLEDRQCIACEKTLVSTGYLLRHITLTACSSSYDDEFREKLRLACEEEKKAKKREEKKTYKRRKKEKSLADSTEFSLGCVGCGGLFLTYGGLKKHLAHSDSCADAYGEDRDNLDRERSEARRKKYREKTENVEEASAARIKRKQEYERNRESRLLKAREYYHRNRDRITAKKRENYNKSTNAAAADDGDSERRQRIISYEKNREEKLRKNRDYYQRNREWITAKKRAKHGVKAEEGDEKRLADLGVPRGVVREAAAYPDACSQASTPSESVSKLADPSGNVLTMPAGWRLGGRSLSNSEVNLAEGFLGLSVNGDFVEVRPLMHKDNVTAEALQTLLHCVCAVNRCSVRNLLSERGCPVLLVHWSKVASLRNQLTKEMVDKDGNLLEEFRSSPPTLSTPLKCSPAPSKEEFFLSGEMEELVPDEQLLLNNDLQPRDMGAVAVFYSTESGGQMKPVFSASQPDWGATVRIFFSVLLSWIGGEPKDALRDLMLNTPCCQEVLEQQLHEVRLDCHQHALGPKVVNVCEHCGKAFEYNDYLIREVGKFKHHQAMHSLTCRVCGESFPHAAAKTFHQRTHNPDHVKCIKSGCPWVGTNQKALDLHVKLSHTSILCHLCGNKYACNKSLHLHLQIKHKIPTSKGERNFSCRICGRGGYLTQAELNKHERRHQRPNSLVNRRMATRPEEYKYVCTLHDNCTKYFRKRSYLRTHMKTFSKRQYPDYATIHRRPEGAEQVITADVAETAPYEPKKPKKPYVRKKPPPGTPKRKRRRKLKDENQYQ